MEKATRGKAKQIKVCLCSINTLNQPHSQWHLAQYYYFLIVLQKYFLAEVLIKHFFLTELVTFKDEDEEKAAAVQINALKIKRTLEISLKDYIKVLRCTQ